MLRRRKTLPRRYALLAALGGLPVALLLLWLGIQEYRSSYDAALTTLARNAADQRSRVEQLAAVARDHVETMRSIMEARLATGAPAPAPGGLASHVFAAAEGADIPTNLLPEPVGEAVRWSGTILAEPAEFLKRPRGDPEVAAALDLFAVQAAARAAYPQLRWSYYLSDRRDFVAVSPWVDVERVLGPMHGRSAALATLYGQDVYTQAIPAVNVESLARWTPVKLDPAGAGLMVRLSAPVHAGERFHGVVGTDLLVGFLSDFLRGIRTGPALLALEDQSGQIVADTLPPPASERVAVPLMVERLGFAPPPRGTAVETPGLIGGHRLVALPVADTPWRLIAAVPEAEIRNAALRQAAPYLTMLAALALMLMLFQVVLRRQFVRPAMRLVGLIRAKAAGEKVAVPKLPALWRPWADRVAEAFDSQQALVDRLSEAEAVKSGIIASALDAVVTADSDLRIISFNPAAERIFGHRAEEVIGRSVRDVIVPPAYRSTLEEGLLGHYRTGVPKLGTRFEAEALRADGSVFPVEISIHEVRAAGSLFFTAYIRDLGPLRAAELELAHQRERLHQSEKMSALGSLLAGVAHELNNPLTVVVTQATLLEELAGDSPLRSRAEKIHAAAQRCGRIVKTFLAMARQQPPTRASVDLNAVVRDALELAAYGLRSTGVALDLDLAERLPAIEADPDQLIQVAVNLVVNAQQAMADRPDPRRLRIRTVATGGDGVVLTVEDNGPGIPPDIRQRIFEPYFTTKPLGVGTGIGLAVCRNIVIAHGGTLELDTSPMGGARFTIWLPAGQPGEMTHMVEHPPGEALPSCRRALVVDDEADVGSALAEALQRLGFSVHLATGRPDAEALIAAEPFDVVFCDLRMPGGGGGGIYRAATTQQERLRGRFVFVTGDTVVGPGSVRALDPDRPPQILEKPFTREDLIEVLSRLELAPSA